MAVFQTDETPYLETYLSVNGNGVKYIANENKKYQAQLSITIEFISQGNGLKLINTIYLVLKS